MPPTKSASHKLVIALGLSVATATSSIPVQAAEQYVRAVDRFQVLTYGGSQTSPYRVVEESPTIRATPGYVALRDSIVSLAGEPGYDTEFRPPTESAYRRGLAYLEAALGRVVTEFPEIAFPIASPTPDGDGGFRLHWMKPGRHLQVDVPASDADQMRLFWRDGGEYDLEVGASPSDLAARLAWFNAG